MEDFPEKTCARCKEDWPADLEFFHQHKGHKDGLHSYCKACVSERCRELRGGLSGWAWQKLTEVEKWQLRQGAVVDSGPSDQRI